jgi:hypothetical protein
MLSVPGLVATAVALLCVTASQGQGADTPPLPFEDPGACPFEGCVYREWRAHESVKVHAERRDDSPVIFTVRKGQKVRALTGIVVTIRAGRAQFDKPQHLDASPRAIDIVPGQDLFLLTYQGEGFSKAWFQGQVYTNVDVTSVVNGACGTKPERCTGRVVDKSQTEWWVQIRNSSGQIGWTREPNQFGNKDAFG